MAIDKELLEILRCPESHAPLVLDGDWLVSTDPGTRRRYQILDDIPNMIVEESETVEEDAWMEVMRRHGVVPGAGGAPMTDTIFGKIIRREIPADIVYEDDQALAFRDTQPQAPIHVLVIPKQPLAKLADAKADHAPLLGHLLHVASLVAHQEDIGDAFRVVVNSGAGAGQSVFHLHLHVLGGRPLQWPPG